jgi:hypothetical protein
MHILDGIAEYLNERLPKGWQARNCTGSDCCGKNYSEELEVKNHDENESHSIHYLLIDEDDPSLLRLGGIMSPTVNLCEPDSLDRIFKNIMLRIQLSDDWRNGKSERWEP